MDGTQQNEHVKVCPVIREKKSLFIYLFTVICLPEAHYVQQKSSPAL